MLCACLTGAAHANGAEYNNGLINFDVSTKRQVANDEAVARLTKTAQAKTAKALANEITPAINQALSIAKQYPNIKVESSYQNSYPTYDNNGKIKGFTGSSSLSLTSNNTEELSELIGKLQPILVLDDLNFRVSDELRRQVENELMIEATHQFQNKARTLTSAWGAKDYKLINAQMNSSNNFKRSYGIAMMDAVAESVAAAPQFEAGDSDINYTINGQIALIYWFKRCQNLKDVKKVIAYKPVGNDAFIE